MFNKKNSQSENGAPTINKVDQDLIVHNMPNRSRLGSSSAPTLSGQGFSGSGGQKSNVKSVGAIIIGLGIILVGALIYLSYRFIIKPQAENNPVNQVATQTPVVSTPITEETANSETATTSSTTPIEVVDPASAPANENVATSSSEAINEELMPEEGLVEEVLWTPILDTDGDGLTDDEEVVMRTIVTEIDTDQDGYLDLAEIKSGYNPIGAGRLEESSSLAVHQDTISKFSILYPASWTKQSLNNGYTLIISAPDNSLFQVSVQDNPHNQAIADWYAETFSSEIDTYGRFKNGNGWEGVMSKDGINFYLTDSKKQNIYAVSYIPVIGTRLAYLNIYQMMIDTFRVQ